MPGFDGTGPLGKGPMTGRCRGFCVLKTSEQKPAGVEGFAGINGKPVADVAESQSGQGKEVIAYARWRWNRPCRIRAYDG